MYFTSVDAARAAKREMQHDGYDGPNGSHNCNSGCEITHVLTPKCLVKTAPSGSRMSVCMAATNSARVGVEWWMVMVGAADSGGRLR